MTETAELSNVLGDLADCNNEKIHLSGAIQTHGCSLFFMWPEKRIIAYSENAVKYLNLPEQHIVNGHIGLLLDNSTLVSIERLIKEDHFKSGRNLSCFIDSQKFDLFLYETDGVYGLELEKVVSAELGTEPFFKEHILQDYMTSLKDMRELREAADLTCKFIRRMTVIDRVMMYKFIPPAFHGEVVGEDRVLGSHSFMNHRFPSSDIPKPARDLYLRNKVRLISDSHADISPLIPDINPKTQQKWNLSDSRLRSVAPIHLEYLRNMGVHGSMSFAVIVKGELWGLIACHHMTPYHLSQELRQSCALMADAFAAHASLIELFEGQTIKSVFDAKVRKVVEMVIADGNPVDALFRQHSFLMDTFGATGIALVGKTRLDIAGITPPSAVLKKLNDPLKAMLANSEKPYLAIESISQVLPDFAGISEISSGLLCVPLNDEDDSLLILFRPEIVKVITWGGNPVKNLDKKNFQGRINPRMSFASWEEVIRHKSTPWASYMTDGLLFIKQVVIDVVAQKNFVINQLIANGSDK